MQRLNKSSVFQQDKLKINNSLKEKSFFFIPKRKKYEYENWPESSLKNDEITNGKNNALSTYQENSCTSVFIQHETLHQVLDSVAINNWKHAKNYNNTSY